MVSERVLRVDLRPGPVFFQLQASSAGTFFPSFFFFLFREAERGITIFCHICNVVLNPEVVLYYSVEMEK